MATLGAMGAPGNDDPLATPRSGLADLEATVALLGVAHGGAHGVAAVLAILFAVLSEERP